MNSLYVSSTGLNSFHSKNLDNNNTSNWIYNSYNKLETNINYLATDINNTSNYIYNTSNYLATDINNTSNYIYNTSNYLATDINNTSNWIITSNSSFDNHTTSWDDLNDNPFTKTSTDINFSLGGNVGIGSTTPNEKLDVVGNINCSGTGYFDKLQVAGIHAQQALSGGGTITFSSSRYLKWSQRILALPVERDEGALIVYLSINCPIAGTIPYYKADNTLVTQTCTINGILMDGFTALFYEYTSGQNAGSWQGNFRLVAFNNSIWQPNTNWILIAIYNVDNGGHLIYLPGRVGIPLGGIYDSITAKGDWYKTIDIKEDTNLYHTEQRVLDIITPITEGLQTSLTDHTDNFDILKNEITEYVGDVYEFKVDAIPGLLASFLPYPLIDAVQLSETNKIAGDGINIVKDLYIDWDNDGDVKKVSLKSFIHYMHGIEKWNYDMHGFNNAVTIIEGGIALAGLMGAITAFKKKLKQI